MEEKKWYKIDKVEDLISPSLLVYPDRIEANIRTMIEIAGGTETLRPHIKTYKMAEIIKLQLSYGISKFKCATIGEAELLAQCRVSDILLAMQPVGANINRYFSLIDQYPESNFATLVDNQQTIDEIASAALSKNKIISLWLDINNGMNRTGVWPDEKAVKLYKSIASNSTLLAKGLHVYDGHLRNPDYDLRKKLCDEAFDLVIKLKYDLEKSDIKIATIVAGGSPTFPFHSKRENVEVSPGTTLLWDQGYSNLFPELKFLPAAVLFSRIISKPRKHTLCFDLGHKSVASEMNYPRVNMLDYENCKQIGHSEEHLVVECPDSEKYNIGDVCYAIPMHICPTVTKYKEVLTVVNGKITGAWKVAARDHNIGI